MRARKVKVAVAAVVLAGVVGVGVAYAVWSASGSGSGAGRAIGAQSLVVTAVTPGGTGSSLYPGGPAGWVYLTIQNPNPYDVNVTHLSWGTPTSADPASCPSSNFSLDPSATTTVSVLVKGTTTSGALQVFNVIDMAHSAPDGCQGVVVNIPVTVTGTQT
jgi:hypothetical protein